MGLFTALRALPMAKKVGLGIGLLALIVAGTLLARHFINRSFDAAEDKGAAVERAETNQKVIEDVQSANQAAETVRRDADAAREQCLRHSRTPENC